MATSLPWSVKGVDPRTRDAAKAAARRAGMTLGEWLDHKIRIEAEDAHDATPPEQLDIAALSERLALLSQGQMDTSAQAAASNQAARATPQAPSRHEIEAVINQAATAERLTRESSVKTAGALDSIARWIEKTENRLVSGERAAAERQERATSVIADAIKSMGERLVDIERKNAEAFRAQVAAPSRTATATAPRLAFSRETLQDAVSDIRTRQRDLDDERVPAAKPQARSTATIPESRIAALRQDLRDLSARIVPARPASEQTAQRLQPAFNARHVPATHEPDINPIESMLADLGARLDRLDKRDRLEPILKPLARIESEVSRIAQEKPGASYERFELEIAHLAAKVDALAARGGDRTMLAPVLRDIGELRDMLGRASGDPRVEELSQQVSTLAFEISRLRDQQPDGREMRSVTLAIEDVREAILSDRSRDRSADPSALSALSRQIESLANKVDAMPTLQPEIINAQVEQLATRLGEIGASGQGVSTTLSARLEALVDTLEAVASRQPSQLESRIDTLQQRIETLAEHGPVAVMRQIEALSGRIESMAASSNLAQMVSEGHAPIPQVNLRPIEDMLRKLAEKIDEAGKPGAEAEAFDSLEQQISGLATRLDAAAATRSAESGIERTLQDLVVHLQNLRTDTNEVAERAARVAMAGMSAKSPAPGGIAELSTLLSGLQETHVSSGRETQDAIGAVHQTLETIISRLASIEAEIASERQVQPSAAQPALPAADKVEVRTAPIVQPPAPNAAQADRFVWERSGPQRDDTPAAASIDLPLEPGSGRPRAPVAASAAQDPQSIRQNLIAAARRSAKAASEAAAPAATPEPAKSKSRLKEIMEKRRRPVLLGLAAIVLAMGAAHVVTGALKDIPAETPASIEPTQTTPAPDAGKDQTSALPPPPAAPATPATSAGQLAQFVQAPDTTGSTTQPTTLAALQPATAPETLQPAVVQPATNIGELPAGLGGPALRKAAQSGDARAVYELASQAAEGPAATRDAKLALRLFERAAVAGLAPAQFRLGNMFEKGIGAPRDAGLARVWYTRAAERGNAKAMHNLAVLHAEGVSGKPDYATATEWFRRAADVGVRDSQYNLAILLGRGLGAPADLAQSYVWFAVAARQGDDDAGRKRDEVAQRLNAQDLAAAKLAADNWKPKALEPAANEVAGQSKTGDESPSASARKPAKPVRG